MASTPIAARIAAAALGDVVLRAGEADLEVLLLARRRVRGDVVVGEVAALELLAPPATGSPSKARKIIRNV